MLSLLGVTLFLMACSNLIEIIGDGDVLSASGSRDCLLEDHQAGLDNCTESLVEEAYLETYYGTPRTGWVFLSLGQLLRECTRYSCRPGPGDMA